MNTAPTTLSDYQRGVLNELGISCWRLQGNTATEQQAFKPAKPAVETAVSSQQNALNRLQQLKSSGQNVNYARHIVCSFSPTTDEAELFKDILLALGLDAHPVASLTGEDIARLDDYVCRWDIADKAQVTSKGLLTPPLNTLKHPAAKKQLWLILQQLGDSGLPA